MLNLSRLVAGITLSSFAGLLPVWACEQPGQWWSPGEHVLDDGTLYKDLAATDAVLLGEQHDRMDHHRWQLSTLAQLRAHAPDLVLALEMLPRSAQPALDAWIAGELDERELLHDSGWYEHWGFSPDLYLPLLHFARLHGIPVQAVNLERSVVQRIGHQGWDAVPADERDGVEPATEPSERYLERLHRVFEQHAEFGAAEDREAFVRSQLARDRAMAQGIVEAREGRDGEPLVVALIGRGHLEYGDGVPQQLRDLGLEATPVLLPVSLDEQCSELDRDLARAVFTIDDDRHQLSVLSLGIGLEEPTEDTGVRVVSVMDDSVAAEAGLEAGDVVVEAAGKSLQSPGALQFIVHRQAPGTWLPLTVERNGEEQGLVARFPPRMEDSGL
ncbi:ChaN family lipoprotein [Aquisalimonas sp.]|uniref:ChaN family lipoprotein n=1 Tax=Aquisalimonas sp. TaxID=1872621 RepID=UPI0025BBFB25|nr:ChaN family lipoprotein [Aquisalimonas sp.]